MVEPDVDAWRHLSTWMPYLFVRPDNRAHSDVDGLSAAAMAALDGQASFTTDGTDVCWSWTDGGVTLTAGVRSTADVPRAVLAVDDRDSQVGALDGKAWKEWLRMSNWLGISDHSRVCTRTLLAAAPAPVSEGPTEAALSPEWQSLLDEAVSDTERELIRALADSGAAVPVLGYETEGGDVIDFAWADSRIGVVLDGPAEADGWTLCPPDPAQILEALKMNGVV
ncbi:hypothetical protein JDV09_10600 [Mycobacterium sp. Y57]|uniref:hypothetical protein n=1 Tax=Mycolicibacterium xanthum TaxID=2796469 RepID=UPI001C844037|nr:hypothetical protein [Mycolicibacterium xanthum]MBX7432549.1 hypothetical protein [Mycolicibacterium xanthum]